MRHSIATRLARRHLIALAAAAPILWPLAGFPQQRRTPTIGYVNWFGRAFGEKNLDALRAGLRDLGYAEGRSIAIEAYFTDGDRARTRQVLDKLVRQPVDVLVACATPAAQLAKAATQRIPIVMAPVADPLATGLVRSLAHPGGNLTGLTGRNPDLEGKVLQFLRESDPGIRVIAFLGSARDPNTQTFVRETRAAADRIGLTLLVTLVDDPEAIDQNVFAAMQRNGAEAVIVQPIFTGHEKTIVPLARQQKLAVVANYPTFAEAGGLLTYGVDNAKFLRRAAYYVDRILKGTRPSDLPVEQPTAFKLVINLKTARALGLTVPQSLLVRADEVIE